MEQETLGFFLPHPCEISLEWSQRLKGSWTLHVQAPVSQRQIDICRKSVTFCDWSQG